MRERVNNNITELMIAASRGDLAEVRRLVEAGQEVNAADAFGNTALQYAARSGHADIVELLIRNGADARIKNKMGRDCLESAEAKGHKSVASVLRAAELLLYIRDGEIARLIELLNSGIDVNLQLTDGWTPLMVAALDGRLEVVKLLLDHGADPGFQNYKGLTAEMIAERKGHLRVVNFLRTARKIPQSVIQSPRVESDILDLSDTEPGASLLDEIDKIN